MLRSMVYKTAPRLVLAHIVQAPYGRNRVLTPWCAALRVGHTSVQAPKATECSNCVLTPPRTTFSPEHPEFGCAQHKVVRPRSVGVVNL